MRGEIKYGDLRAALHLMGVTESARDGARTVWQINREIDLETAGIDAALDDLEVEPDGGLVFEGRRVLVYLREQNPARVGGGGRFHIAACEAAREMKRGVVSTRADGRFWVRDEAGAARLVEMGVCPDCLEKLNYKNYGRRWRRGRGKIAREFSLEDFFGKTGGAAAGDVDIPAGDAPSPLQEVFSRICQERAKWRCEECDISLEAEGARQFLRAHRTGGDKSDNRAGNLRALCVDCHDKHPGNRLPESARAAFREYKRRHLFRGG